jgi:hypothetical protein
MLRYALAAAGIAALISGAVPNPASAPDTATQNPLRIERSAGTIILAENKTKLKKVDIATVEGTGLAAYFGRRLADEFEKGTDPDAARRARAEADFQTQRAVKLPPADDEVKTLRAEVVERLQLEVPSTHPPAPRSMDEAADLVRPAPSPIPLPQETPAEATLPPGWNRTKLSVHIAQRWQWRNHVGRGKMPAFSTLA